MARRTIAILAGGGIAATLDIVYACVSNAQYLKTPLWVFQSVASGWLGKEAFEGGALFGILVYLFMNFVVLPLSAFPWRLTYDLARVVEGFASHALFVGIPIALCVRRFGTGAEDGRQGN